jgi:hypothetical protein
MVRHLRHLGKVAALCAALTLVLGWFAPATNAQSGWTFPDRRFRAPLTVNVNSVARTDRTAEVNLNFATLLTQAGGSGTFQEASLRVAEVDQAGAVLDDNVPFQFDNAEGSSNGTLVFLLKDTTAADATRRYQVYFDSQGTFTAPSFTDRVVVDSVPNYRGQDSFRIVAKDTSNATSATYYYHKVGAGFASLIDKQGNDWIDYDVGNKAFRGIPNAGEWGHPGYTTEAGEENVENPTFGSTSTVVFDGPLKTTIRSTTSDPGKSAIWTWDFYPGHATMTIEKVRQKSGSPVPYWLLYEGTPGGVFQDQDFVVRSNNGAEQRTLANQSWSGNLNPDWAYFGDANADLNRVLFTALQTSAGDAGKTASYRRATNSGRSGTSPVVPMTVFGFGRLLGSDLTRQLSALNSKFTIGLAETDEFGPASAAINSAYQAVGVTVGQAEQRSATNQPPTAQNDTASTRPGVSVSINVIANDTDPDGNQLTPSIVSQPANGAAGLGANRTLVYTPTATFTGTDSFTYKVSDGQADSAPATVTITVSQDAPTVVATNDTANSQPGQPVTISVLANDTIPVGATATITVETQPTNGAVAPGQNNTLVYTPNQGFTGTDTFTYRITAGGETSAPATVTVSVTAGAGNQSRVFLPITVR